MKRPPGSGVEGRFEAWSGSTAAGEVKKADAVSGEAFDYLEPDADGLLARLRELGDLPAHEPVARRIESLGRIGERLLTAGDPMREAALRHLPRTAGLSAAMSELVLDGMARDWTPSALRSLVDAEFANPAVLDGFVTDRLPRMVRAQPVSPALHLASGNVPGVGATSLIRGLLVGSALLVKPGRGDVVLPVLAHRILSEEAPELAERATVQYWPGGSAFEAELIARARLVVSYGGADLIALVRRHAALHARLVEYPHRVSVGLVGADAPPEASAQAALAVATFDQRGCVSPQHFWVEDASGGAAEAWAGALARELERLQIEVAAGPRSLGEASAFRQEAGEAELRAAAGLGVRVYGTDADSWRVVFDPHAGFRPSCLGRFARVSPVERLEALIPHLQGLGPLLQTVAVEGLSPDRRRTLVHALARAGAQRITGFREMAWPPPYWHHDGRGPLEALIRWVDWESVP